ncbi:hypothetical protein BUALT_Bualt16G0026400 [Buddleja alternifolia]|uniref:Saccharopine dehydrogenase NADP binding domain-containing protein n=1 Tax=Buddleja alternifolia TaxID=168488 RepID=A0AAV6WDW9_9LAMI|nr:hypothetical protein BUALT_Bualt16G0026400 [Buddleja alternifolia]
MPPPQIFFITADTSYPNSLARLAAQTKIILNCVGPFWLYGQSMVSACVDSGCDYLHIYSEPEFMERMGALYHERAVEKGSLVISACGFDSIPTEMGMIFHLSQWARSAGPTRVEAYLSLESSKRMVGNYGTYESAVIGVANADKLMQLRRSKHRKARHAIPGPAPLKGSIIEHHKEVGLWAVKLPSADSTIVRRTLSTLAENPHGLPGVNEIKKREAFCHLLLCKFSFGRWLLLRYPSFFSLGWFKKAGLSEDEVASSTFKMLFVGHGFSDGSLAPQGDKNPDNEVITRATRSEIGYITTSIVLLQCALELLNDRNNFPKGGVYTPGIVFGPTDLQERLQENGISFDFVSKSAL